MDQSPIGRTPRSNPATYMKAFDAIRELFAETPDAKRRGYAAGHFSFNVPGGRCETCQGDGTVTVEMQFLADVELVCEECRGQALQEQRARSALSREKYSRRAGNDGARSAGVFRKRAESDCEAARAERNWSWIFAAGAIGDNAFRRRGAAAETGVAPDAHARITASFIFSTSRRRVYTSTTSPSCWRRSGNCWNRALRCW